MYKHILIPTDGSDAAQKGVDHGLSLAKTVGAKVTIISVTEPFPYHAGAGGSVWAPLPVDISGYEAGQKRFAEALLAQAGEAAAKLGLGASLSHVTNAQPAEAIVEAAKAGGCDLIVMASHGRRGLDRLLLGSQTSKVLAYSATPVLVVR
jgi:nucleotide-binding universal stress UspA family protein